MTSRSTPMMRAAVAAALAGSLSVGGAAARADDKLACVSAAAQAQQLRDEGKLKQAREQMLLCARDTCPQAIRKDCSALLTALDASLPSIVLSAQDANKLDLIRVRVSIDGKPFTDSLDGRAISIDPGPHLLRFEVEGQKPVEQRVLIREGEQRRTVTVQFPAPSAPAGTEAAPPGTAPGTPPSDSTRIPVPIAPIVLGSVGLVALGSFATFGILGKNELATLHATCGVTHSCLSSEVDATRSKLIAADVSLGVSVIAIGIATGLLIYRSVSAPAKTAAIRAGAFPVAGGAAAAVGGRF